MKFELKISGIHAISELFKMRPQDIIRVYVCEDRVKTFSKLLQWCASQKKAYHIVKPEEMKNITESIHHEGVCALVKATEFGRLEELKNDAILVLEGVANPHNLGAIVRSAAHFGIADIVILNSPVTLSGAYFRTAEGGAEHVRIYRLHKVEELKILKELGYYLLGSSSHTKKSIYTSRLPKRHAWIVGAEGQGLSKEVVAICDDVRMIPGTGNVESLNVAVATSLLMSESKRSVGGSSEPKLDRGGKGGRQ